MFTKLRRRIMWSIMTIALVFAATVTAVSFGMISNILYTKNKDIAAERFLRGIKNSLVYMESIQNSCITLTDNENLPQLLFDGDTSALVSRLDYFTSYALTINGAVITASTGRPTLLQELPVSLPLTIFSLIPASKRLPFLPM